MVWTAIALAATWLPAGARQDGAPVVVGASVAGVLPAQAGARIVHPFLSELSGNATLCLKSFDFDARLEVHDGNGRLLAEATGGGVGQDAYVLVALDLGAEYRLRVGSDDKRGGEYRLEVLDREIAPLSDVGEMRAQIEYWETAEGRARERGDVQRTLTSLRLAAQHAAQLGWLSFALDRSLEALRLSKEAGNGAEASFAGIMAGSIQLELGNYDDALALLEESREALDSADNPSLRAFLLQRLGELHERRHELDKAESLYNSAYEVARKARLPEQEARALGLLGSASAKRAHREAALELHGKSLEVAAALSPQDQGLAHYVFGQSLLLLGELDQARNELESATDLASSWIQLLALHKLGELERRQGHYWRAFELLEAARLQCEASGHELLLPGTLVELAGLARNVADDVRCEALLEQALQLTQEPWFASRRIAVLNELAELRDEQNAQEERRVLLETAVELASDAGYAEEEARCRLSLGACHQDAGLLERAQEQYDAALRTALRCGATSLAAVSEANLASAELSRGRPDEALQGAERAYETLSSKGLRLEALYALETVAQAAMMLKDMDRAASAVDLARTTLNDLGHALGTTWESGFRSREAWWAEPLDQDLTLLKVANAHSPDERTNAVQAGFRRASEWKGRALHARLAGQPTQEPSLEHVEVTLGKALGPTTLLIEYVRSSDRLMAYTLHRGRLGLLDLGPHEEIEARANAYARKILDPSSEVGPDFVRSGRRVYDDLLGPALAQAQDAQRIVIVPTTALAALPFEALPIEASAAGDAEMLEWADVTYVLDRYVVTYGPSSSVLAQLADTSRRLHHRRVLILADPDYERGPAQGRRQFTRLPGTRMEAALLAELVCDGIQAADVLGSDRDALIQTPELTLCLGSQATPTKFQSASEYSILHCAAHGVVDPEDPHQTGIALSFEQDTGFLSVTDVLGLEFAADLVVLSACETAQGRIRSGEGVQSMAYAFLGAGARSVIANLWKVEDEATAAMMQRFYQGFLRGGLPPAEALTAAKRSFRSETPVLLASRARGVPVVGSPTKERSRAHPSVWAAHIFVGLP